MQQAKKGDTVKVHYVGSFVTGEVFDSSVARQEPIEFTLGAGQMIEGFETAILGMSLLEKKQVTIHYEQAYGPYDETNVISFPLTEVPEDLEAEVGMQLILTDDEGHRIPVTVIEKNDEFIVMDGNHPMAGQNLVFDIELLEITA